MGRFYVTTAIPYVNARPHLGHVLEFVQADVLARWRRQRGDLVRFLSGTDDNASKNVQAAEAAGVPVDVFVDRNASWFEALREPLELSFDDFIRTSADVRHRPAVERIWRACAAAGDLYRGTYEGLYCVGCEQFYDADELIDDRCPEHGTEPERVAEENWFFRLSRYEDELTALISSDRLRIRPETRRNEILAFLRSGLRDVSVSRTATRAAGWGIGVPGDGEQSIYVWFDALVNYVAALGYGDGARDYDDWWGSSDERVHVIGKGILRFHAVWWIAILLSSGQPLPTSIFVHDYLTANGRKLSKSSGDAADPFDLVERYGTDAVRWWLLRAVPRVGDADFTEPSLVQRYNEDLAGGIGNLVSRVSALVRRYGRDDVVAVDVPETRELARATSGLGAEIDEALEVFDFRRATGAILDVIAAANRCLETTRPWEIAGRDRDSDRLVRAVLDQAWKCSYAVGTQLGPFLPLASVNVIRALRGVASSRLFPRIQR